ncbi:MAG: hypothetical protein D3910_16375 [Candidatus Electrothrix sp. ATG2]|nr:hypothetical protein [Candidatus Electrothrix sp. ATG2]
MIAVKNGVRPLVPYFSYVTDEIIEATIQLRRKRKIKTPDAVIAATALVQGLHVCTRNISDFKNIGVDYINPFEEGDELQ